MNGMILGMMFAALAMIASAGYLPAQPSADNNALALADDLMDGDDGKHRKERSEKRLEF